MKKILLLFSSLGIGSSALLSSTASIKQNTNVENIKTKNTKNSDIQSRRFLICS